MANGFCFALWYGPQYRFGYGIADGDSIEVTWLEKLGLCEHEYSNIAIMFESVVKYQGWTDIEGLAMTIISDEMYETEMKLKLRSSVSKPECY